MDPALLSFEVHYPAICWRKPIEVTVPGVGRGLACRVCVGSRGLKGSDVGKLPKTEDEFQKHMQEVHLGGKGSPP